MEATFTKTELIDFANYVISKERTALVFKNPDFEEHSTAERLQHVTDADFENWINKE
jgi:hypothetical protein